MRVQAAGIPFRVTCRGWQRDRDRAVCCFVLATSLPEQTGNAADTLSSGSGGSLGPACRHHAHRTNATGRAGGRAGGRAMVGDGTSVPPAARLPLLRVTALPGVC